MASSDHFKSITLSGFRGYLYEQTLDLQSGKSLVVYSPNGKGKSSLVDAVEFTFSSNGTVARLGERRTATQGGREALSHHDAEVRNISSFVEVKLGVKSREVCFKRSVNNPEPLPEEISDVLEGLKVPFIIRGFELRRFVENESPSERYESVSNWFGFSNLVKTQNAIRKLKLGLNREISSDQALQLFNRRCSQLTEQRVTQWNEGHVLTWYREKFLEPLDAEMAVITLSLEDPAAIRLEKETKTEAAPPNINTHKAVSAKLKALLESESEKLTYIQSAIEAAGSLSGKEEKFELLKASSSKSVFNKVWSEAKAVLENTKLNIEDCPVCDTPFIGTSHKNRDQVKIQLGIKLSELTALNSAEKELKTAQSTLQGSLRSLKNELSLLSTLAHSIDFSNLKKSMDTMRERIEALTDTNETIAFLKEIPPTLKDCRETVDSFIREAEQKIKPVTWKAAKSKFEELVELKNEIETTFRRKRCLEQVSGHLSTQASIVDNEIKGYVTSLITSLSEKTNDFYKEIQSGEERIPNIRLELPPESRRMQNALDLLIDFSDNRKGVPPAGYLSDSQIHTLALSLRLAAISLFNKEFPLIVLDDIVTSYDSDHRQAIAAMLAKHTQDQQVIVVTHDEQFFQLLNERLSRSAWIFKRIVKLDLSYGPKYADHRIVDEQIEAEHDEGSSAANLMRQSEEEWLTDICRGFQVEVKIRPVNRPYNYSRSELAMALHRFLKDKQLTPPQSVTYQNPFLSTLQSGTIENTGSHFSDNPHSTGSVGDEKVRWRDFKEFRSQFKCPSCQRKKFIRPDTVDIPICKSCNTPFAFPG